MDVITRPLLNSELRAQFETMKSKKHYLSDFPSPNPRLLERASLLLVICLVIDSNLSHNSHDAAYFGKRPVL